MPCEFNPKQSTDADDVLSPILAMGLITAGCAWDNDPDDPAADPGLDATLFPDERVRE